MAFADTAELAVRLTLDDRFSRSIRGAQGNLGKFQQSIGRVGKGLGQVSSGMARAGTIIAGVATTGLVGAAKAAIDFEDAFAGVKKTVDETQLAAAGLTFEKLARQFRDMALEIPIAATELAAIGETAGALGIKAQDIDDFTRTVALLGVTTDLTSEAAAEALGKVGTILGLTGSQFEDFADVLVNLGNQGASTESEIIEVTKRFAAMGKQAGLSTPEILALASAATSLGAEPEAAGSALSRIFANMSTEIALASDKGKAFAQITGRSLKQLGADINRGDALPVLLDFLKGLQGLSRTEAAKALRGAGIGNVRDRDAILKMAQNLGFVNDQLKIAEESTGALSKEAQKRFDTVASKIQKFRNAITEAAITLGEGFAPAVGRAAERLSAFLLVPANVTRLQELGKDIGDAIDNIDWARVISGAEQLVGVMKGALSFAKLLFDAFMALPGPIKEAAAGFLVLNKLSGGLIGGGLGNVIGGLGSAALQGAGARLPGIGRVFAQPVFVTNWPLGGLSGKGGLGGVIGGGAGKLGTGLALLTAFTSIVGVVAQQQEQSAQQSQQGKDLHATLREMLAQNPSEDALLSALGGVEQGIRDIESNPLNVLVQGSALDELKAMRGDIQTALKNQRLGVPGTEVLGPPAPGKIVAQGPAARHEDRLLAAIIKRAKAAGRSPRDIEAAAQATLERNLAREQAAEEARTARLEAKMETLRAAEAATALAAQRAGERAAGAIGNIRPPIVDVDVHVSSSSVTNKTVVIRRAGPVGGSRERSGPLVFG